MRRPVLRGRNDCRIRACRCWRCSRNYSPFDWRAPGMGTAHGGLLRCRACSRLHSPAPASEGRRTTLKHHHWVGNGSSGGLRNLAAYRCRLVSPLSSVKCQHHRGASHELCRGLTLRCTRSATAGFARLHTRVSSNVRPHGTENARGHRNNGAASRSTAPTARCLRRP
jgi:hypothetical protein